MISNTLQRKIKLFGLAFTLVFSFILLSTDSAQAQWRNDRNNRNDRRNDRRWGNTNKRAVENLIKRVEDRTDNFSTQVAKALDRIRLDGSRREDNINDLVQRLENATDELRREFDRSDSLQENRDEVQRIVSSASNVERSLRRSRLGNGVQNSWRVLKNEINALARVYGVRGV